MGYSPWGCKESDTLSIAQQSSETEGFLYKNRCLGGHHFQKQRDTGFGHGAGCVLAGR